MGEEMPASNHTGPFYSEKKMIISKFLSTRDFPCFQAIFCEDVGWRGTLHSLYNGN